MTEAEAMAVLTAAVPAYGRRNRVLAAAGSAAAVLADPGAFAPILGAEGASAVRECMREAEKLLEKIAAEKLSLVLQDDPAYPPLLRLQIDALPAVVQRAAVQPVAVGHSVQ